MKWHVLVKHLENMIGGRTFDKKQRDKAKLIKGNITDEYFMTTKIFNLDSLSLLSTYSLQYQVSGKSVIGDYATQMRFKRDLEVLRNGNSHHLKEFLQKAKCTNKASDLRDHLLNCTHYPLTSCGTLENYESSKYKAFKCIRLYGGGFTPKSPYKPLSTYMSKYVDEMLLEHQRIFMDIDPLHKHFDALDHRNWEDLNRILMDRESITEIGKFFKIQNFKSVGIIWNSFKQKVMESPFWCNHKKDKVEKFWQSLLQDESIDVPLNLRQLVKKVLVLGISSADAERVFSILGNIHTKRRERCTVISVEDQLRIIYNGPK